MVIWVCDSYMQIKKDREKDRESVGKKIKKLIEKVITILTPKR